MFRIYTGLRLYGPHNGIGDVDVYVTDGSGYQRGLAPRYDLIGLPFEPIYDWAASRPNRLLLAASILADFRGDACARTYHRHFADEVLTVLDPCCWSLTPEEIECWLDTQQAHHGDALGEIETVGWSPNTRREAIVRRVFWVGYLAAAAVGVGVLLAEVLR